MEVDVEPLALRLLKGKRRVKHVRPPFEWAAPVRAHSRKSHPLPVAADSAKLLTTMSIGNSLLSIRALVQVCLRGMAIAAFAPTLLLLHLSV